MIYPRGKKRELGRVISVSPSCISKLRSMEVKEERKEKREKILMALITLVGGASDIFPLFFARGEIRRVIVYN